MIQTKTIDWCKIWMDDKVIYETKFRPICFCRELNKKGECITADTYGISFVLELSDGTKERVSSEPLHLNADGWTALPRLRATGTRHIPEWIRRASMAGG